MSVKTGNSAPQGVEVFAAKTGGTVGIRSAIAADMLKKLGHDPKITALTLAATRAANAAPPLALLTPGSRYARRFVALFKARNRRVRVQLRHLKSASLST